eukprot:TRINITY_DN6634_c0_g1_i1.p1 TRINITY_DN6634_c0_g1~~TRINITY_DN6634_c0_g1_i1.p1  ORF type:complete len:448 (+),score=138.55 TRINITY_DN6634_c0_g1_i1:133-1476(+)
MTTRDPTVTFWVISLFLGTAARFFMFHTGWNSNLENRVELVTPFSSLERLKEGVFYARSGNSPYDGSQVHYPPLVIWATMNVEHLASVMIGSLSVARYLWILLDLSIAVLIKSVASLYLKSPENNKDINLFPNDQVMTSLLPLLPFLASSLYFLLPFSILSCGSSSYTLVENFFLLLSLVLALKGRQVGSVMSLAVAVYTGFYTVQLIVPIVLVGWTMHKQSKAFGVFLFFLSLSILCFLSTLCEISWREDLTLESVAERIQNMSLKDWKWMEEVYGALLSVRDLTPNIGLFWYLFQEIFQAFRTIFCFTFQLNCFAYVLPLSIKLWKRPVFLFWAVMATITALKPYPTGVDLSLEFGMFPIFWVVLVEFGWMTYMLLGIFVAVGFMMPIAWEAWIYQGNGNSNFFYAATLAVALAQARLVPPSVRFFVERDYLIKLRSESSKLKSD